MKRNSCYEDKSSPLRGGFRRGPENAEMLEYTLFIILTFPDPIAIGLPAI